MGGAIGASGCLLSPPLTDEREKNFEGRPFPRAVENVIVPPASLTMPYTIDSPSPVPFSGSFVVKNGSKMNGCVSTIDSGARVADDHAAHSLRTACRDSG